MPFFTVFVTFNLNVNCVKIITFVTSEKQFFRISFKVTLLFKVAPFDGVKIFINDFDPEFIFAFFYSIYRIQLKCKLCKDNNIFYENFHQFLFQGSWMPSFTVFIEFLNCIKTITFVMKIFIIFLFQGSWMHSFKVFIEFNLNVNCVQTITFVMKILIIFLFQSSFMPSFMVLIKFNLNVICVKTITFVMKIYIIFLFQSSWMPSFMVLIKFTLNVNCVKTLLFVMKIFIINVFKGFMDAFFNRIYRLQFKCNLCKETITFVLKILLYLCSRFHVCLYLQFL